MSDLFESRAETSKLNPDFKMIQSELVHSGVRSLIIDLFENYEDIDGNFIGEFQSAGFDARCYELYLDKVMKSNNFKINSNHQYPDIIASKDRTKIAIEIATTNPTGNENQNAGSMGKPYLPNNASEVESTLIKKSVNLIHKKYKKSYWEYDHVKGIPFCIALENFSHADSLNDSGMSLVKKCYGLHYDLQNKTIKKVEDGLFDRDGYENISAIIFTNQGTVGKFSRMAQQSIEHYDENIFLRCVKLMHNHDPSAFEPIPINYEVSPNVNCKEYWEEGIIVIHNHRAVFPIARNYFPCSLEYQLVSEQLSQNVKQFHSYKTINLKGLRDH